MHSRSTRGAIPERPDTAQEFQKTGIPSHDASNATPVSMLRNQWVYRTAWYGLNVLLVVSILFVLYTIAWEYSTRRYLKGFSDAVVPARTSPEEKITAILTWMAHGPARLP